MPSSAPSSTPWRGIAAPMLAVAGPPPTGPYWREWKFDGHRARAEIGLGEHPRLISRGGRSIADRFPEVVAALHEVLEPRMAVLDGELVAPGERGLPDFERLQARARSRPTAARQAQSPVNFVAFDLLALDGRDLTGRPLSERRSLLGGLGLDSHPRLLLSPVFTDVDPDVLLAAAREHGMEGVVSKRSRSTYAGGRRSKAWVKTVLTQRAEFAVGGVARGRARRPGAVGALLLGSPTPDGGLEYVGEVATGWARTEFVRLTTELSQLITTSCPFTVGVDRLPPDARFVEPTTRGVVVYREHRAGGLLRHPSWKGVVSAEARTGK